MATLDVSAAFDPSFLTPFYVKRPRRVLNDVGEWQTTGFSLQKMLGVVTPLTSNPLMNPANGFISEGIKISTQEKLEHQTEVKPADELVYNNRHYQVMTVEDYSKFGAGFYVITAQLSTGNGGSGD